MATIRESVTNWLLNHPREPVTVTKLATELSLTRRQTLNALHGLKRRGLEEALENLGSGVWQYIPVSSITIPEQERVYPKLPVGWKVEFTVVASYGPDRYLCRAIIDGELSERFVWVEPIFGEIEFLISDTAPGPTTSPGVRGRKPTLTDA